MRQAIPVAMPQRLARRRTVLLGLTLTLALALGAASSGCGAPARSILPEPDQRATPDLSEPLRTLDGRSVTLASFRGQILLVNFFSTDCLPCLEELPLLVKLRRELQPRGFEVVGISLDLQGALPVELLQERYGLDYPLLLASERMFRRETPFGTLPGLPMSVLLDRQGRLAGAVLGILDPARVTQVVEALAEEK